MMPQASAWLGSVDSRDRKLLIGSGVVIALLTVALGFLSPQKQEPQNRTPYSYSAEQYGAKAGFELLSKTGYKVDRQYAPLSEIADRVDAHTTLVIAEPDMQQVVEAQDAIKQALNRGARVLVTGFSGAWLVPGKNVDPRDEPQQEVCEAEPNGFGKIANSGKVRMRSRNRWGITQPLQWVEYTCGRLAVVVRYAYGKGEVIWWASSFPLENTGIQQEDNVALFLNSIGPVSNHVIWDESLHGLPRPLSSYVIGTPVYLLWAQLAAVAFLLLFSYSRRSGPLRPDPIVSRATPVEFVHSLGSLYHKAGATSAAVAIVYQRLRHKLEKQFNIGLSLSAEDSTMLELLTRRFGTRGAQIQNDMRACEQASRAEDLSARQALVLVQSLYDDEAYTAKALPD